MTMADDKCEVCQINKPIGVGCTMIPYSCAYCVECLDKHAQPMLVFLTWESQGVEPRDHTTPEVVTFDGGKYTTYTEWWKARRARESDGHQV
jgi:hypothetical protein